MEPTPDGIDLQRPNVARVYDYYLGGSHNFAADQQMARQAIALWPQLPMIIRANRAFLVRAVRFLIRSGVRQFLDLGSGIPTVGSVHQVAQRAAPDASVVYVDHDPVAVAHADALLADNPRARAVALDLRRPDLVLGDERVRDTLDLDRPVAVLMVAVLHFVPDRDRPAAIVAGYRDALATGTHLVVSHATDDSQPPQRVAEHRRLYTRTATPMTMRSRARLHELLTGWHLVDPGLVWLPLWRPAPDQDLPADPERFAGYAAVGVKR